MAFDKMIIVSVLSYLWHFQSVSIRCHALRMGHMLYEDAQLLWELCYHGSHVALRTLTNHQYQSLCEQTQPDRSLV